MSKKNLYVMNEETGKYEPISEIKDANFEQLTLDFDEQSPTFDINFSGTIDIDKDSLIELLDDGWVVDPDDAREELITQINKLHDAFLNGIYHVTKAEDVRSVNEVDRITKDEVCNTMENIDTLLRIYYKSCYNEYLSERDDAFAAFTPEKLN